MFDIWTRLDNIDKIGAVAIFGGSVFVWLYFGLAEGVITGTLINASILLGQNIEKAKN